MPKPNAFDYFVMAGNAAVDGDKIGYATYPGHTQEPNHHPYTLPQREALVRENAGALRTLRKGLNYSYCNPLCRSFGTVFPYYAKFRGIARLLVLQAQVEESQGDYAAAAQTSLDAVQEGGMMPHGSTLIGMLVGIACQAIGRAQAWRLIDHLSAAQAEASARRMEGLRNLNVPIAETLQEEKWSVQAGLMQVFRQPDWTDFGWTERNDIGDRLRAWFVLNLLTKRTIMSNYSSYMDQSIQTARLPYALHKGGPNGTLDIVSRILVPVTSKAQLRATDNETQNALLMTALALRAYKLEHGAYPAALGALVPQYLSRVPDDPFALSGPLRYKPSGGKYVLYSVGPDGKDDGGRPIYDPSKPAPGPGRTDQRYAGQQGSTGDIVAGVNLF